MTKTRKGQLGLFARPAATLNVPAAIEQALRAGAALSLSLSGGKDSEALARQVVPWFRAQGYPGHLFAIHADLGRAEWEQTPAVVQGLADELNIPLVVVQRTKGDLVQRIIERMETTIAALSVAQEPAPATVHPEYGLLLEEGQILTDEWGITISKIVDSPNDLPEAEQAKAHYWPDAKNRYCTSHLKAGPIDQALRNPAHYWPSSGQRYCTSDLKRGPIDTALRDFEVIISAEGVRADESTARAKKPAVELRPAITASSLRELTPEQALKSRQLGQRVALNWRPMLDYNTAEIWEACGTTAEDLRRRQALYQAGQQQQALQGWASHPAYVYGNERLSCALCVLGSKNDLVNGANHNPDTYGLYLELEVLGGSTFKHKESLFDLPVTGRAAEVRAAVLATKQPPAAQ